jgi:DNA-binding Lrp family transcriptional regulator
MSKKSREAIRDNLARAIAPPPVTTSKRSAHLDGLLDEYAPVEQENAFGSPSTVAEIVIPAAAPSPREAPPQNEAPPRKETQPLHREAATPREAPTRDEAAVLLPATAPHFRFAYEVLDKTLSKLDPFPRTVLLRLYRLSAGFNNETCHVSIGKLVEHCKMGATKVRACLRELENDGYIKRLSIDVSNKKQDERGITFKVLLPRLASSRREAPTQYEGGASNEAPSPREPNKERTLKRNTLTQNEPQDAAGAGVSSRFSLKQCISYAQHRKSLDPNMRSAEAVGRKLYDTGREDELIDEWLNAKDSPALDISQCPDCHGAGMYYPEGLGKGGVKKCSHEKLNNG